MFTLFCTHTHIHTHSCKHYLLSMNRKEVKLMLKFRNIHHQKKTTPYGKQEVIYFFHLYNMYLFYDN